MKIFILLCLFAVIFNSRLEAQPIFDHQEDILEKEWNEFKIKFNKTYESEAENYKRFRAFLENRDFIEKHNAKFDNNEVSFKVGLNKFSDLYLSQFSTIMNGFKNSLRRTNHSTHLPIENVPDEIDWRKEGYVTEVKDQSRLTIWVSSKIERSAYCWAFSAVGALEGQTYRKTKKLVSLSAQNLIDCSRKFHDGFGDMVDSFEYIRDNHGINTEKFYPYAGAGDKCRYNPANKGADIIGYANTNRGDEDALLKAVATIGPISAAIDASQISFQNYRGGVYDEPLCRNGFKDLNHAVLVVGYGLDKESGKKYWLVKNSAGESWGENGYIRMVRGKNNQCGIATSASYPLV